MWYLKSFEKLARDFTVSDRDKGHAEKEKKKEKRQTQAEKGNFTENFGKIKKSQFIYIIAMYGEEREMTENMLDHIVETFSFQQR